jgi:RimJ/RimL family protein N-acetyltransferase
VILKTERICLRPVIFSDVKIIHELHCLPEIDKFNTSGIPSSMIETEDLVLAWLTLQSEIPCKKYIFVIENLMQEFLGLILINIGKPKYFNAEISYKIFPKYWNNGFATEAVKLVLDFCFNQLKLHRITAGCATENIASAKVLEKSGFLREGHCRKILPIRGQWFDNFEFAILEEDFKKKNKSLSVFYLN